MVAAMESGTAHAYRYALAGMIAMAVGMGIGRFIYTPVLPGMVQGLGLSASDAGLIASANYLGYLVGAIAAAGSWAQGRERAVMIWGLLGNALLAVAMALTTNLAAFLLIRFAAGVASAFVLVFASTIVFSHLAADRRMDLQGWHFGGIGLGIVASALLTGGLHLAGAGWAAAWIGAGAVSLAGLAVVAVTMRDGPVSAGPLRREPALPRTKAFIRTAAAYGIFGFGYIVTATFLVAIIRQEQAGALFESLVWLVTGLAVVPSVFLWAPIASRFGNMAAFAIGAVVESIGVVASVTFGGYAGPLLGGLLLGGTFIAITAIGLLAGRVAAPEAPRRALATMTACFGVGQIIGPIIAGLLADRTGSFTLPSLVAAAALLLCALIGFSAGDPVPRQPRH